MVNIGYNGNNISMITNIQLIHILKFSLSKPLPSGVEVLPIYTLPLLLQAPSLEAVCGDLSVSDNVEAVTILANDYRNNTIVNDATNVVTEPSTASTTATAAVGSCNAANDACYLWSSLSSSSCVLLHQLANDVHANCIRSIQLPLIIDYNNYIMNSSPSTTIPPISTSHPISTTTTTTVAAATTTFSVYALESPGYLGIAGKVWDSMYVLLQYLSLPAQRNQYVQNKRIIELGSGTGLAGNRFTFIGC